MILFTKKNRNMVHIKMLKFRSLYHYELFYKERKIPICKKMFKLKHLILAFVANIMLDYCKNLEPFNDVCSTVYSIYRLLEFSLTIGLFR